ncbi:MULTISPECIES: hypothetical protein [unclassified Nocardioides]|uniref:hypothetical protein n=1 Tax=unclassified Nocardioides TaxID=2615069 RepID=UPI0000570460|nr:MULTISPECIES: hypothetical protein [unclassified Nocardioides]ABL83900.1 hypothetical protein Noca_4403 [Nocardioides sp. JS614]
MREKSPGRRLAWALVAAAVVVATAISMGGAAGLRPGGLGERYAFAQDALGQRSVDKNAISRAGDLGDLTRDPTTAAEKAAATAYVDHERALPDPELTTAPIIGARHRHPQDRYALAGGCYTLTPDGDPFYFKATDLGSYLIYDADRAFLLADGNRAGEPSADTVWDISRSAGGRYSFRNDTGALTLGSTTAFRPTRTTGCTPYPESQIDITGRPHAGVTPFQEVRGYVDGHTHGMAFEFLGGDVHCGKPWDRYGAPYALVDCPDHTATGGYGGVLESVLSGEPHHDPVGWPTFKDWPAPNSLTHEGTYYRWLERSWRGGQRIFVNLLVENNQLCQIYPIKRNSCDDMDSVRLQAKDMYAMQDYIDAQFGGPGKGFYRIVKNPYQAREVINAGKMAVVMGIETSVPFGCTFKALPGGDVPACDVDDIDAQLDQVKRMGVRQMELVNKFDNALSGIAGDNGEVGVAVNSANFLETGTFWDMEHCEPEIPGAHDHNQLAAPDISAGQQDALFGAIGELFGPLALPALPVYPPPDHCNSRGLTTLGEYTIRGLAQRHMIFDPDHMSVRARTRALDQIDDLGYHGVISSHSWSTPDAYPRIYADGGFITPYAGDSTGFVEKWRTHLGWADPRYYWGIGYGADMNGLGAQGDPRGADVPNPVTYPFTGLGGVRVGRQHAGERVYDINVDGVAQYGLYPDWIQDLGQVADAQHPGDGAKIEDDMARGAEAYLQMWERAEGIAPDSCRNADLRLPVDRALGLVRPGMTTKQVMQAVGQPYTRLGATYGFCARTSADPKVMVTVTFSEAGRVTGARRA